MHRRRKADEKFCVTFLLCDPGKLDVQNKWEENRKHTLLYNSFKVDEKKGFFIQMMKKGRLTRRIQSLIFSPPNTINF